MKKIVSLFIITLILASCGGEKETSVEDIIATGDLKQIKEKKSALEAKQTLLSDQLQLLNDEIEALDTNKKLSQITTFKATQKEFDHYLELQGNVSTKQNIVINPEFSGVLTNVYVKEGQRVNKGQQLAKIDDGGLSQQLAQLEIQTNLAKTTYERQQRLWNQKIGSEMQYLQAKSNYEAQQEVVNNMKSQIAKTIVRAPFSGTIDDVITDQGTVVSQGQTQLFRIVNLKDMYIETDVPETYITSITKGKKVIVDFPVLGKSYNATVRQAGNFINAVNRTFKIEVAVPNKDKNIKPNLTAKLKINDYSSEKAFLIPQSIISENAKGEQYIYVVNDIADNIGTTKRIIVKTGKAQDDIIEVIEGLESNMEIVEEGARSVKEGQQVEIVTKN
ncbi:efflux RND transporter periplasmic adaptor subunit [Winogradskyella sp.]|jgi:RND family efflux transporter MFP subunit|uniref:efflux RND transporter periplasmic adaptor subunit n=1 Tax=Winogradskyella sp. TaxID=1883156 RepID=UPI0025F15B9C|nr:efflux RND transporter periplasmic adaptor subunit [Winogradskyella sp.]MCT4630310.1 efflux RND transporter periplasmic adaptor subunit [Winogradskyella sp.]